MHSASHYTVTLPVLNKISWIFYANLCLNDVHIRHIERLAAFSCASARHSHDIATPSVCPSVRLSVCHALIIIVLKWHNYHQEINSIWYLIDSSLLTPEISVKFHWVDHPPILRATNYHFFLFDSPRCSFITPSLFHSRQISYTGRLYLMLPKGRHITPIID